MNENSELAEAFNRSCHCINVDQEALRQTLESQIGISGAYSRLLETHPHLLAESPVFISREHAEQMAQIIRSIGHVASLGAYQELALGWAPDIARIGHGPRGVFFGYDFHLTSDGPKLIEVNSNAGGVLLLFHVASAQQACCRAVENLVVGSIDLAKLEQELIAMFREELELQFPGRDLVRVAIVDESPNEQFLSPEFVLFKRMFANHGIDAAVVGPEEFTLRRGALQVKGGDVDLVYNRLTDFYLASPTSDVLNKAYREGAAAFTPGPRAHALYANKRNLTVFSDPDLLNHLRVNREITRILSDGVPKTVMVTEENADALWGERKRLFFKPMWGFGSKGTYRGSKLTRRTWQSIVDADYVAQELIAPSERLLAVDGEQRSMKLDVRCYVYDGEIQLLGARMYRGQTTNFRTDGGGLAAVFMAPSIAT